MTTIDVPEVIALLERAVAEKGADYVYPEELRSGNACVYALPDGSPACIVGYVLSYKGLLDHLAETDEDGEVFGYVNDDIENIARQYVPEISEEAAFVLRAAQIQQDGRNTWGAAVEATKREAAANGYA